MALVHLLWLRDLWGAAWGCAGARRLGDEIRLEGFGYNKAFWVAALVPGGPLLLIATGEVLWCFSCPGAEAAPGCVLSLGFFVLP